MSDDVKAKCLAELKKFLPQQEELEAVAAGEPLFASSSIDSVTLVGMVVALEDRFAIEFDADNVEDIFFDLTSLSRYVTEKLSATPQ